MIESLEKMPTASLIVLCVFVFVCFLVLVGVFAPQMVDMAKERLSKDKADTSSNSDKLDAIQELLETKINNLEKTTDLKFEIINESLKGLVTKIDDGFRNISRRLDDHIANDKKV